MNKALQGTVIALFLGYFAAAFFYPSETVQTAASLCLALACMAIPLGILAAWIARTYLHPKIVYRERIVTRPHKRKAKLKKCPICKKKTRCRVTRSARGFLVHRVR